MAIDIIYEELFRIEIKHEAFSNYNGLRISPTPQTQKIIEAGRMKYKMLNEEGVLFFRATDASRTPLVNLDSGTTFTFMVEANNKGEFMTKTDLEDGNGEEYDRTKMVLFKNDGTSNPIKHSLTSKPRPRLFNYLFTIDEVASQVTLEVENTKLKFENLQEENGAYRQQLEMSNYENGKYKIIVSYIDGDNIGLEIEDEIYVDDYLAAKGIIGLIEIDFDQSNYLEEVKYEFGFAEKITPP